MAWGASDYEVAGTSSVTYCTVAEADAFLAWRGSDAWSNATDDTKEGVLEAAVRVLDELPYRWSKSDSTQALRFPTVTNTDDDGNYVIPDRVKEAQAEMALAMLEDPDLLTGSGDIKQVAVPGAYSVTMQDRGNGLTPFPVPEAVLMRLKRYLFTHGPVAKAWDSALRGWV